MADPTSSWSVLKATVRRWLAAAIKKTASFASAKKLKKKNFSGTLRGPARIAIDRFLVYGAGGVAFGSHSNAWPNTIVGTIGGVPTFFTADNANNTRFGYAAGAGVEYAFTPNWSVKVDFTGPGHNSCTFVAP